MKRFQAARFTLGALALATFLSFAPPASADAGSDAQAFVQRKQGQVTTLLQGPAGAARDAKITAELEDFADYDELARRSFGQPCPAGRSGCTNHWAEFNDAQKTEMRDLLKRLVIKNYKKILTKIVNYDVDWEGARAVDGGDIKVRAEAYEMVTDAAGKHRTRKDPMRVEYLLRNSGGQIKVVDIVSEGSSQTRNYYDQFHKMLTNPTQGYPYVVKKMNDAVAKKE